MELEKILSGETHNHILPFLWVHGESERVYRENVRVVRRANIRAFCIEARPHNGFCRQQWWDDLKIILDETEKLGMKVWILDDKHFPTGYANGGAENMPSHLRRQSILKKEYNVEGGNRLRLNLNKECHPPFSAAQALTDIYCKNYKKTCHFTDDRFLSAVAVRVGDKKAVPISLDGCIREGKLIWKAPAGSWKVLLCYLSRNCGVHRNYINMMDEESCRIQIEQVYEPHYEHFKEQFGTTIAGFFSDEPELGNGIIYKMYNTLGTDQDLPWSRELETALEKQLGEDYSRMLPLLWNNDCDQDLTARVRYIYMDQVSRLVEKIF